MIETSVDVAAPTARDEDRDPGTSSRRGPDTTLAALGVLAVLVGGVLLRHSTVDLPVTVQLATGSPVVLRSLATTVYLMFSPVPAAVLTAACVALVTWRVGRRQGAALGLTVALAWLPVWVVKLAVDRPRPDLGALTYRLADSSYPSGHTAFITVLAVVLVMALKGTPARRVVLVAGPVLVVVIALSVLVLGVHHPTDVLASLLWGTTLTPLVWRVSLAATRGRVPVVPRAIVSATAGDA